MLSVLGSSHPGDRAQPTSLPRPTPAHRAGQARQRFVDEQEGKMIAGNGITGRSSLLDWDQIFTLLIIKPGVSLAFSTLFIPPCLQWQTQSARSRCRLNTCFHRRGLGKGGVCSPVPPLCVSSGNLLCDPCAPGDFGTVFCIPCLATGPTGVSE